MIHPPLTAMRIPTMRNRLLGCALLLPMLAALVATAQDEKTGVRYGFDYNATLYPQKTPAETIQSIVNAIDNKRVDYLLAQIAEPKYVDAQVAQYKEQFTKGKDEARTFLAFDRLAKETVEYFLSDPLVVKELRLFAKDGKWDVEDDVATGTAKGVPARKVFLKHLGDRWFLENRQQ
jgi:hypothetical protein